MAGRLLIPDFYLEQGTEPANDISHTIREAFRAVFLPGNPLRVCQAVDVRSPCALHTAPCVPVPTALPTAWQLGVRSAVFQRSLTCDKHSCDISHTFLHPQRFLSHLSKHWVVSSANLHLFPLESLILVFKKKRTGSIPGNFPHLVTVSCRNGKHKCSPLGRTGALWMTWVVAAPALVCRPRRSCPSSPVPPERAWPRHPVKGGAGEHCEHHAPHAGLFVGGLFCSSVLASSAFEHKESKESEKRNIKAFNAVYSREAR